MLLDDAKRAWHRDGFVILPGYLPAEELAPALGELDLCFPSADGFTTAATAGATSSRGSTTFPSPARNSACSR